MQFQRQKSMKKYPMYIQKEKQEKKSQCEIALRIQYCINAFSEMVLCCPQHLYGVM